MANTKVIESLLKSIVINLKKYFNRIKTKIIECYDVITEMGGQIPLIKNIDNLPTAIASIPGKGDCDIISGIRLSDDPSNPSAPTRPLPYGLSLAQLLFTGLADKVTDIVDTNVGRTMTHNHLNVFPNVKHVSLGCEIIDVTPPNYRNFISSSIYKSISFKGTKKVYVRSFAGCVSVPNGIVDFSDLEEFYGWMSHNSNGYALISACANEKVDLSKLHKVERTGSQVGTTCVPIIANSPNVKNIDLSAMSYFYGGQQIRYENRCYHFRNCPNVECIRVGKLTSFNSINFMTYNSNRDNTYIVFQRLIKFEIGQDTAIDLKLAYWQPSYILSDNPTGTDLIEQGSTAENNLQQFLSNFKTYIAERLTDKGTGLTIILSQEVRDAIQQDPEIVSIITGKGWTISPAPTA